jgi:ketosteroid isomerase-like protein
MSHQGVDLARQAYSAFQDQDLDRFLAVLDPEVEVVPIMGSELAGTVYRGHEGIRDWWDHFFAVFRNFEVDLQEVRDLGDRVIAASRFQSEGAESESGAYPDLVVWTLSELRNDKIIRWRTFRSEAEALEATRS